jgi:hypothetical protein
VALAGAGLAALSGAPGREAAGAPRKAAAGAKPATGAPQPAPAPSAQEKEFERQKTGTLGILKTIRTHPLPPGGDLPVVFRPLRTPKKER